MGARPSPRPALPSGEARERLIRALAELLLEEERRDQARAALRRLRP